MAARPRRFGLGAAPAATSPPARRGNDRVREGDEDARGEGAAAFLSGKARVVAHSAF
ncbi:hypothetical protein SCE1572_30875 [Sorangium cellulosum So0157-2]|uniref:Uncharacterized protein n=1 Tax=Sorangium cellulosum So0157-2 TaxID=1254432 RepID=S4Y210_SORCE|nr:hypothetical protein SCE1572_30875 [Sorangium cellulosum So0157-2]